MIDYLFSNYYLNFTEKLRGKKAQVFDLESKKFFVQEYDFGGTSQWDLMVFLELSKLSAP